VLSQRPGYTGSGIFLESLVREANAKGIVQHAVIGLPTNDTDNLTLALPETAIHPVLFETPELPFLVTGMSDEMPYPSSRFSSFDESRLKAYLAAFKRVLLRAVELTLPEVLWTHHLWLVSALVRELFPNLPQITFSHGTELRQLKLAPKLAPYVIERCQHIDKILALSKTQSKQIIRAYRIKQDQIEIFGAGLRDDLFKPSQQPRPAIGPIEIVYVGKLSNSKGVPWLLEAFENLKKPIARSVRLTLVGGGYGPEAEAILAKGLAMGSFVRFLGVIPQEELAELLRVSHILVLPSFFEGLGLVVLEALACGCRIVTTKLPSLCEVLPSKAFTSGLVKCVPLPRMAGPDQPISSDLPSFTAKLSLALTEQVEKAITDEWKEIKAAHAMVQGFSWKVLFRRVLEISQSLRGKRN
jgi:glycosyltransferase involved in cell wall biosynthesis